MIFSARKMVWVRIKWHSVRPAKRGGGSKATRCGWNGAKWPWNEVVRHKRLERRHIYQHKYTPIAIHLHDKTEPEKVLNSTDAKNICKYQSNVYQFNPVPACSKKIPQMLRAPRRLIAQYLFEPSDRPPFQSIWAALKKYTHESSFAL